MATAASAAHTPSTSDKCTGMRNSPHGCATLLPNPMSVSITCTCAGTSANRQGQIHHVGLRLPTAVPICHASEALAYLVAESTAQSIQHSSCLSGTTPQLQECYFQTQPLLGGCSGPGQELILLPLPLHVSVLIHDLEG